MLVLGPTTKLALSPFILLHSLPDHGLYFAFDAASGDHFRLNRTSFWLLETVGPGITWADLCSRFLEAFDVEPEVAVQDLLAAIGQCDEYGMIRRLRDGTEEAQAPL